MHLFLLFLCGAIFCCIFLTAFGTKTIDEKWQNNQIKIEEENEEKKAGPVKVTITKKAFPMIKNDKIKVEKEEQIEEEMVKSEKEDGFDGEKHGENAKGGKRGERNAKDGQNSELDRMEQSDKFENAKRKRRRRNADQMSEIIEKFDEIKRALKSKMRGEAIPSKEWMRIETEIARKIDSSRRTIYQWKRELGMTKGMSKMCNSERLKIVEQFEKNKSKLIKLKAFPSEQIEAKAVQKLGFSVKTIKRWKTELGLTAPKKFDDARKKEILRRYEMIKREHPRMRTVDIARGLGIGDRTLFTWRQMFGTETDEFHILSSDDSTWTWNMATKRRSRRRN